jgi:hypothetical protein
MIRHEACWQRKEWWWWVAFTGYTNYLDVAPATEELVKLREQIDDHCIIGIIGDVGIVAIAIESKGFGLRMPENFKVCRGLV